MVRQLAKGDHLPDYRIDIDESDDMVVFENRQTMPVDKTNVWDGSIGVDAFEKVGTMSLSIDKYALEQEFRDWIAAKNIVPKNPDAMFIKFALKRSRAKV